MAWDSLAQAMVDLSAQGQTLAQISASVGLPEDECQKRMKEHLDDLSASMSATEMRMLQLRRLEHIISVLWEQVINQAGYGDGGSRNFKNLIEVIAQVTELMDLKKDRLREEQVRLTQAHTLMVLKSIGVPQEVLLHEILGDWIPEERHEVFREYWNKRFPELAAQGLDDNSEGVIQLGQGAGPVEVMPAQDK